MEMEKEIIEKIKTLIESLLEEEKNRLLAGIFPAPLNNLTWKNLFLIWQRCEKEEFCKIGIGKKLRNLLRGLKNSGYFEDFE